jgi:cell division protease FtsH
MTLRALATSSRPLSESFIDRVRRGGGFSRLAHSLPASEEDDDGELDADREDERHHSTKPVPDCAPDIVVAAILLGRAFESSRDTLAKLSNPDTVAIIQVPYPDLVQPVRRFLRILLTSEAALVDGDDLHDRSRTMLTARAVIVFTEHAKSKTAAKDDGDAIAAAMKLRSAVIGIVTPLGELPKALLRLAELRIVVPPIDAAVVADVIEAVTAARPAMVDASMAARVTVNDLAIAVRTDIGAERSLERLQRLVGPPADADDGPRLSEIAGLGEAKAYCMEVADAMRAYLAGELPWNECPHGLLLSGPAGIGKTSIMRALCRELSGGVTFIATSYAAWQAHKTGHLGDVTSAIRATFFEAARRRPASSSSMNVILYLPEETPVATTHGGLPSSTRSSR